MEVLILSKAYKRGNNLFVGAMVLESKQYIRLLGVDGWLPYKAVAARNARRDGTLNGTIAGFDCKTLVFYIDNAITPGDRLTYTLEKQ